METTVKKKTGNPNYKKKENDIEKMYEFELIDTFAIYKPVDTKGFKSSSPFPPIYVLPNKGIAFCEKTNKQRAWRFIPTEDSIWIDEQREITSDEERVLLSSEESELIFKKGRINVRGLETAKLQALQVMDMFGGKNVQLKKGTPRVYKLLNPDEDIKNTLDNLDKSFEAEKSAREASEEEMYQVALVLGINLNQSDKGVRKDFIIAAKQRPDYFLKQFVNPKNKFIYAFSKALEDGTISSSLIPDKLVWVESQAIITDVKSAGNVAEELATRAIMDDTDVNKLFNQLSKL